MNDLSAAMATLSAMITPAVLILACGSLIMTTSQRLTRPCGTPAGPGRAVALFRAKLKMLPSRRKRGHAKSGLNGEGPAEA